MIIGDVPATPTTVFALEMTTVHTKRTPSPCSVDDDIESAARRKVDSSSQAGTAATRQIGILVICGMAYQTVCGMCMPLYAQYAREIGLGEHAGGLVIGAPSAARCILNLFLGRACDKFGRRPLLVGGCLVMAAGAFGTAAAASVWMMLLSRLFVGAGGAASDIAAQACRLDVVARLPAKGTMLGFAQSLTMLAYAAGPALGGQLAASRGVRAPFDVFGTVLLFCAPLYALLPDSKPRQRGGGSGAVAAVSSVQQQAAAAAENSPSGVCASMEILLRDPRQRALLLMRFSVASGWAAWMTVLPVHLSAKYGLSTADVGRSFSLMTLLGVISSPVGGCIADRLGRYGVACIGACVSALALGMLPLASNSQVAFWLLMACWEVGEASLMAATAAVSADVTRVELRGAQSSMLGQVQDVTFVVMPTALSWLSGLAGTSAALVCTASLQGAAIAAFSGMMWMARAGMPGKVKASEEEV